MVSLFTFAGLFNLVVALILWSSPRRIHTRQCNNSIPTPRRLCWAICMLCDMYIRQSDGRSDQYSLGNHLTGYAWSVHLPAPRTCNWGHNHPRNPYLLLPLFPDLLVREPNKDSLRAIKTIIGYMYALIPVSGILSHCRNHVSSKI